jgi:hypothetical protein
MMAKFVFVVLAVLAASAMAEITPVPCQQYLLSSSNLGATPGFLPNILFYNAGNLMGGNPQGPWFSLNSGLNCFWAPDAHLSCPITLYQDSARTQVIGSGSLSTNSTYKLHQLNGFVGGDLILSYNIVAGSVTTNPSPNTNYVSRETIIHMEAKQTYPDPSTLQPAVANKAILSADQQSGMLTLWGSNGWTGTQFSGQTTGFDFRATLTCHVPETPPVIEPCVPAPGSAFSVPYGCVGQTIRFHSSTTSIGLSFTAGPAAGCSNF